MRVGIIQSCYLPWRGYFDFIASVDLFVLYDDVQYSNGSFRNRNQLKMRSGLRWMTVPVTYAFGARIDEVAIVADSRKDWRAEHRRLLAESLGEAPFFRDAMQVWETGIDADFERLTDLNERLTRVLCEYLGVRTRVERSSAYSVSGASTSRLIALLERLGATSYLSGPSARGYLDEQLFRERGIRLEYKRYTYPPYPQLHGEFIGAVSVLDLIANCGPQARDRLASVEPDEVCIQ